MPVLPVLWMLAHDGQEYAARKIVGPYTRSDSAGGSTEPSRSQISTNALLLGEFRVS